MSLISSTEQSVLSGLVGKRTIEAGLHKRISILLAYNTNQNKKKIAEAHDVGRAVVYQWLRKWEEHIEQRQKWQASYEATQIKLPEYEKYLSSVFQDAARSGTPRRFDDQTIEKIVSLAASDPTSLGLPFSRWSEALLQKELIKRKLVKSISTAQIGRFLKKASNPTAS